MSIVVCKVNDIEEGDAKGFKVGAESVVVAKKDDILYAYLNSCPHLGIELNFQPDVFMDMEKRFLQCANHGALFQVEDGLCIHGPCNGQSLTPIDGRVVGDDFEVDLQA